MAAGLNGPPTGPKLLHYVEGDFLGAKTHHKPIRGARPTKRQHTIFLVFFFSFLSLHPAKAARQIFTIYTSNDAFSRKEVPLGGLNACKNFQEAYFPPNLGI
jgi:hypothetical protein